MLCIAAAAVVIGLPLQDFTLAWTHSIEKERWEEDYRIAGEELRLMEARIRGSGAGMEIPADAVLRNGVWHYQPKLPPLSHLRLARSAHVADYLLCQSGACRSLGEFIGPPEAAPVAELFPCKDAASASPQTTLMPNPLVR